jgi:sensor domain CHASE-containing protein/signal transduction histidine kinase
VEQIMTFRKSPPSQRSASHRHDIGRFGPRDWAAANARFLAATLTVCLLLGFASARTLESVFEMDAQERFDHSVHNRALSVRDFLHAHVSLLEALAGIVQKDRISAPRSAAETQIFRATALAILKQHPEFRTIAFAPNGIVSEVYPIAGNEGAIGHNLLTDPRAQQSAMSAIDSGQIVMEGPVDLRQGGTGLIFRKAVYLKGAQPGWDSFTGFVVLVIDTSIMLDVVAGTHLSDDSFDGFVGDIRYHHEDSLGGETQQFEVAINDRRVLEDPASSGAFIESTLPDWSYSTFRSYGADWIVFARRMVAPSPVVHYVYGASCAAAILLFLAIVLVRRKRDEVRAQTRANISLLRRVEGFLDPRLLGGSGIGTEYRDRIIDRFRTEFGLEGCVLVRRSKERGYERVYATQGFVLWNEDMDSFYCHASDEPDARGMPRSKIRPEGGFFTISNKSLNKENDTHLVRVKIQNSDTDYFFMTFGSKVTVADPVLVDSCAITAQFVNLVQVLMDRNAAVTESALEHVIKALVSGVSHDFANLVGLAKGNLDDVKELATLPGDHSIRQMLDDSSSALSQLLLTLRTFQSFGPNSPQFDERFDLWEAIYEIRDIMARAIPHKIEIHAPPLVGGLPVISNRYLLKATLSNLILNASAAASFGTTIRIEAARCFIERDKKLPVGELSRGHYVRLSVKDHGPGFDLNRIDTLLRPWTSNTETLGNRGLGLFMASHIVERSGGAIDFVNLDGGQVDVYLEPSASAECTNDGAVSHSNTRWLG